MPLSVQRTRRTGQGYIEPLLEVGDALPLHMVFIAGDTFTMGSPKDEPERNDNEGPQHSVTVPTFFMGRYPITQAQWRVVAAMTQINHELKADPSDFKGDNRPVETVSWYEAVEFCDRISAHTHRQYRLPTEAEWEYACRGGTTTPFNFGKTLTDELANYDASVTYNGGPKGQGQYRQETTPVDQFPGANAYGLHDMHGNVWEWCQDHWHDNYDGAPNDGKAWTEDGNSDLRVLRGGSWLDGPWYCRSAVRYFNLPDDRYSFNGFRVVCSAPRALP